MQYVYQVDFGAFRPDSFHSQRIVSTEQGVESCRILCTRVPPGKGGPFHIHAADQFYYILTGNMNLELAGRHFVAGPESLVWIPAGAPHRNWNSGDEDEIHFELIVPAGITVPIKRL